MKPKLKIKVCGMQEAENIAKVGQLAPDYMGIIFYSKSPRFVDESEAASILKAIPEKTEKIGVFVNELIPEIIRLTNIFGIKTLQLHGSETPEYCEGFRELGFKVIKAFGINGNFDFNVLREYEESCDFFLFDTKSDKHGGTGQKFNWKVLSAYDNSKPIFLSGGIGPNDADTILQLSNLNIHSLDINSCFEKEPGVKDIDKLTTFINTIRIQK